MGRVVRVLRKLLVSVAILVVGVGMLGAYLLYAPTPQVPTLSAGIQRDSMMVGGRHRRFALYVPAKVALRPPLLMVLHGSAGSPGQMRRATAYRFEQLADEHGFIVVYPHGYEGYWNDCRKMGPYSAKRLQIDDVGFLRSLVDQLRRVYDVDSARVFAAGASNGAHMTYRLALEAPDLVRGVAAVAANVPAANNFDCNPQPGSVSVMIINGTDDPINPFMGGRVTVFGLGDRGDVLSAEQSASYFAAKNGIGAAPSVERVPDQDGGRTSAQRTRWRSAAGAEVVLYAIEGGGHTIPQKARGPRLLGRTHTAMDGPAEIWRFFAARAEGPVSELP